MTRFNRPFTLLFGMLLGMVGLLATTGCDSGSGGGTLDDIAGEYTFTTYRFTPDSQLLAPVNMLDTLRTASTVLQVFSGGKYTLMYQFTGGTSKFIGGDISFKNNSVTLNGSRDDDALYRALLLTSETTLAYTAPDRLTASLSRRVNLEAFSNRYKGLPAVDGTLELSLRRK